MTLPELRWEPAGCAHEDPGVELIFARRVNSGSDAISEPRAFLVSLDLANGYNFAIHLSQVAFALFLAAGREKRWTKVGRLLSQTSLLRLQTLAAHVLVLSGRDGGRRKALPRCRAARQAA